MHGEDEFLFAPYSCFTVRAVHWEARRPVDRPSAAQLPLLHPSPSARPPEVKPLLEATDPVRAGAQAAPLVDTYDARPHRIEVDVAPDNRRAPSGLPLAPWC